MKSEQLTDAQIAWILWNLHERLNELLWARYEKEFLDWVMDENYRKEMDRTMAEELDPSINLNFCKYVSGRHDSLPTPSLCPN